MFARHRISTVVILSGLVALLVAARGPSVTFAASGPPIDPEKQKLTKKQFEKLPDDQVLGRKTASPAEQAKLEERAGELLHQLGQVQLAR